MKWTVILRHHDILFDSRHQMSVYKENIVAKNYMCMEDRWSLANKRASTRTHRKNVATSSKHNYNLPSNRCNLILFHLMVNPKGVRFYNLPTHFFVSLISIPKHLTTQEIPYCCHRFFFRNELTGLELIGCMLNVLCYTSDHPHRTTSQICLDVWTSISFNKNICLSMETF